MGTETNNQREQLEFEDIKSELDAIVASLGEYNKNVPLDKLSDIASMAKFYGIYDNLKKWGQVQLTLSFIKPMKYINNSFYKANFEMVA